MRLLRAIDYMQRKVMLARWFTERECQSYDVIDQPFPYSVLFQRRKRNSAHSKIKCVVVYLRSIHSPFYFS